ncbi:Protein CLEC-51, partial [Aphelenchoides avenae]
MRFPVACVVFIFTCIAVVASRCHPGAVQGLTDHECYVFGKTPTTWMEAEKACSTLSGHLTSVSGHHTNSFLATSAVPCLGDYWLGGFKGFDSKFKWTWTDGRTFRFSNWAA